MKNQGKQTELTEMTNKWLEDNIDRFYERNKQSKPVYNNRSKSQFHIRQDENDLLDVNHEVRKKQLLEYLMKQAEKLLKNNNLQAKKKEVRGLKYMVSPIRHPYNKRLIFVEKKIE